MRIILADCYHDSDKGGGGIVAGALGTIEQACAERGVQSEISLMFRFSEDDPRFRSAARLTSSKFPRYEVLPAPISSRRGPGIRWLPWGLRALVLAPLRLMLPQLSRHRSVRAMRGADLVIFKGGNFYRSWCANPLADAVALFVLMFPILLAIRLGRRFCLISHTFGPFHSALSRRIVRWILQRAFYVSCREHISRDILLECGLSPERVAVTPDTAFATHPTSQERLTGILGRYGLTPRRYAAVTTRPWFHAERRRGIEDRYRSYITGMAALCDYLLEGKVDRVALVVQNDGAHSVREPDIGPLREIRQAMQHGDAAVILDEDFPFDELTAIYGNALLTLGTRLHSCIFSLAVGTPAIAVAYGHKAPGIMAMAGAEDYILDIGDLSVAEGKKKIDDVVAQRERLSARFRGRVAKLHDEIRAMMEEVLFGHLDG